MTTLIKSKAQLLCLSLFLLTALTAFSQDAIIRGFVYDKENGEPIIFTNVVLEGTTIGATTDVEGFYSINKVPEGTYNLTCTYVGYETSSISVTVGKKSIVNQQIFLAQSTQMMDVVEVSAAKGEKKTEVQMSTIKVTSKQINKIPSVGGEPDLAQYLQVLPGVTFSGDQGGQLYVRGGAPIETKVLLDGLTIYNPFHSIGLFSVFETDIIKNVDVKTGGFEAEYGGRVSAIVDVATKDGNKKQLQGKVAANPFMGKLMLEGPLKKLDESGASSSFIFSGKHSYLKSSAETFYPYINNDPENGQGGQGLPYTFTDLYSKLSFNSSTGSKVSVFGYRFKDDTDFAAVAKYGWDAFGVGSNFVLVPGRSKTIVNGRVGYSKYSIDLSETGADDKASDIGGFELGIDFSYFMPKGKIKYGIEIAGFTTDYRFLNTNNEPRNIKENTTRISTFMQYRQEIGKLLIEPSIRLNYYASLPSAQLEPRIGMKYNLSNRIRLKAAAGRYTQDFISTKPDRDVVSLFNGFLTSPETSLLNNDGEEVDANLQIATHLVGGVEFDLTKRISLNVEGYRKGYDQIINLNRNRTAASEALFAVEDGEALGVDVVLKYDYKRIYLWTVYSYGIINRRGPSGANTVIDYHPHYDRRHNMNIVGAYTFGKNLNWEASFRWALGSGFPFTQTQGFYEELEFTDGTSTNYLDQNGDLGIVYDDELNGGRLPYYHRLDASIKRNFLFGNNMKLEVTASVTNSYNRENIFYFDRIEYQRVNQLPILPSLGVSMAF